MSFAAKVDALRRFLGVPPSLQMVQAVVLMNEMMGVIGEGPLPAQVEALMTATGVEVAAAGVKDMREGVNFSEGVTVISCSGVAVGCMHHFLR